MLFTFHVCLYNSVLYVFCIPVITCWEGADLLALLCVICVCVLSLFHMVSRVRGGTFSKNSFRNTIGVPNNLDPNC